MEGQKGMEANGGIVESSSLRVPSQRDAQTEAKKQLAHQRESSAEMRG